MPVSATDQPARKTYTPRLIAPEVPRPLHATPRDIQILDATAQHRLLTAKQLIRLFAQRETCQVCHGRGVVGADVKCSGCVCALCLGAKTHATGGATPACTGTRGTGKTPSPYKLTVRLRQLFQAGLLTRPPRQLLYHSGRHFRLAGDGQLTPLDGSPSLAYALSDRGARLLLDRLAATDHVDDAARATWALAHQRTDIITPKGRLEWLAKNTQLTHGYMQHTLEVADFAIAVEEAVRTTPHVTLWRRHQLIAALSPAHAKAFTGFCLPARYRLPGAERTSERTITPDYVFALAFPDRTRRHFCVEIDRGTERLRNGAAAKGEQTTLLEKLIGYVSAWAADTHTKRFGWKSFAVLIVAPSAARAERIRALIQTHPLLKTSQIFLVIDRASLAAAGSVFAAAWATRTGTARLLPKAHRLPL